MAKQVTTPPTETTTTPTDSQTQGSNRKQLFERYAGRKVWVYGSNSKTEKGELVYSETKKLIDVSELGTNVFPFIKKHLYFWIDVPIEKKDLKVIDHRTTQVEQKTEKALVSIHEKDFVAVYADFFNEQNQVGTFAFTYESAAELFWLYQGITPEKFLEKYPRKFNPSDDYDMKRLVASQILASAATKHIANRHINIYEDFLYIEGVSYEGEYTQENIMKNMPPHIKAQF